MNLKSVLLSSPIRVAGGPASKKWESDPGISLTIEPPFIVVGVRKEGVLYRVGVPAVSVQQVEYVEEPTPSNPPTGPVTSDEVAEQIDAATQPKGKKGKG